MGVCNRLWQAPEGIAVIVLRFMKTQSFQFVFLIDANDDIGRLERRRIFIHPMLAPILEVMLIFLKHRRHAEGEIGDAELLCGFFGNFARRDMITMTRNAIAAEAQNDIRLDLLYKCKKFFAKHDFIFRLRYFAVGQVADFYFGDVELLRNEHKFAFPDLF